MADNQIIYSGGDGGMYFVSHFSPQKYSIPETMGKCGKNSEQRKYCSLSSLNRMEEYFPRNSIM